MLDTVITELLKKKERKFIIVEIAYFMRWWREQAENMKSTVKMLLKNKQLEFINGGWCMNGKYIQYSFTITQSTISTYIHIYILDEGTTHYTAVVDQMTMGHQFLLNEFDIKPNIGWHIGMSSHEYTHEYKYYFTCI